MYLHPRHRLDDPAALLALVDAHPLGAWVVQAESGLVANHVPFLLDRQRGASGTLIGHVARANPVWRMLAAGVPSVVMFQGPQAYITPGWYPGKQAHGQVVPTWDYAVAHVHGTAVAVHDHGWLMAMLQRLTDRHEARQDRPWQVADAPGHYVDGLLRGIVGIEIPIDRLDGKCKASQDEDLADRRGTVQGLLHDAQPGAAAVAALVQAALDRDGHGAG
jgi:transcriptional regulator